MPNNMHTHDDGENRRAHRISIRINEQHILLARIYENLVDRDAASVDKDVRSVIIEMRLILKALQDDDF
jgi:hypothetical protein